MSSAHAFSISNSFSHKELFKVMYKQLSYSLVHNLMLSNGSVIIRVRLARCQFSLQLLLHFEQLHLLDQHRLSSSYWLLVASSVDESLPLLVLSLEIVPYASGTPPSLLHRMRINTQATTFNVASP